MESDKQSPLFIGIDIGGTLGKLCIYTEKPIQFQIPNLENLRIQLKSGEILFNKFKVTEINVLLDSLAEIKKHSSFKHIYVTGGGAFKFSEELKQIDPGYVKVNEMASLVEGFNFLDQHVSDYSFFFRENLGRIYTNQKTQFPYFLVNIGSGVSILKFNSEKEYERVGGTSLGGGTFLGMCNLLIGTNNFDELLELAQQGLSENADLLIKDIYRGSDSPHTNLKSENLAVSLGKLSMQHLKKIKHIKKEDIAKSLLVMVAFNISQIAYLFAKIHQVKMIYFAGNFIRNHNITMECISHALDYFSQHDDESINAIFLKHDGFVGALGCILEGKNSDSIKE